MSKKYVGSPELRVKEILLGLPTAKHYWLAYSGGLDSHLLLHLLVKIKDQLKAGFTAVHINHGFSQNAPAWQRHCQAVCQRYGVTCRAFKLDKAPGKRYSEAWAREQRYQILGRILQAGDVLLTAHHMNDQVETMLLNLLRGAGPAGLAAMPLVRPFSAGLLVRPLLRFSKAEIKHYASKESLHWVEDESNKEITYGRNYLRHEIIPNLLARWPAAIQTINRAIRHQADICELLAETALDGTDICSDGSLGIARLSKLSEVRRRCLLRHWLKQHQLPIPGQALIDKISEQAIHARVDRNPSIAWSGAEVRRYRNRLYAMRPLPGHDVKRRICWRLTDSIELPLGKLSTKQVQGAGINQAMVINNTLEIRYRQGGEKIKPTGRVHTQQLKKLFQAQGIPPWRRNRIPLLYLNDRLIAVGDLWIDSQYAAGATEAGWQIEWHDCSLS